VCAEGFAENLGKGSERAMRSAVAPHLVRTLIDKGFKRTFHDVQFTAVAFYDAVNLMVMATFSDAFQALLSPASAASFAWRKS